MKNTLCTIAALVFPLILQARAGDAQTLVVPINGFSEALTLNVGESAELKFSSYLEPSGMFVDVTIGPKTFSLPIAVTDQGGANPTFKINPVKIAGPATLKIHSLQAFAHVATFDVTRVGTASGPVPIPQDAGTNWQVILEASSDLVNWTAVAPGTYPSSTPQKYFRTRLVKQ